ncbi:hypothetical protein ACVV62_09040 [Streptococcus pluranimalium]
MATKEEWTGLFEIVVGRKPTVDEFMAAKEGGFDPSQIMSIAGFHQNQTDSVETAPANDKSVMVDKPQAKQPLGGVSSQIPSVNQTTSGTTRS